LADGGLEQVEIAFEIDGCDIAMRSKASVTDPASPAAMK
jgi:hypothetical protein